MEQLLRTSSLAEFEKRFVKPNPGRTLIVGSRVYNDKPDRRLLYENAVGVDMSAGEGVDVVQDLEQKVSMSQVFSFDHVECMSVLEHSRAPWLLAANLQRMLKPGGTIFVTVPFIWAHHGYPSDYWRMTPEGVAALFPEVEWSATAYAEQNLNFTRKIKRMPFNSHPFFPRTETVCFGVRK